MLFKNLFVRFKSKYICCSLQNKIIKNSPTPKEHNWTWLKPGKTALLDWTASWKHFIFITWFSRGESGERYFVFGVFSIRRAIISCVLWKHFAWIFTKNNYIPYETLHTPIETFLQHLQPKSIIFCDFSLPRLGKNMRIAMQNMTIPPKQILKYTWHIENFSFILENYHST